MQGKLDSLRAELANLRIVKDLKYTALYWALGFEEISRGVFEKHYGEKSIRIVLSEAKAYIKGITCINGDALKLDNADSFVILELADYFLSNGVDTSTLVLDFDNEFDFYFEDTYIACQDYDVFKTRELPQGKFFSILYQSKLYSGLIERKAYLNGKLADFSIRNGKVIVKESIARSYEENGFKIEDGIAVSYDGESDSPIVPQGVKRLSSGLFWDNQKIREVILPEGLISLGGDTFYGCSSLERITIPSTVEVIGDNPFAGCSKLQLINESKHFIFDDEGLRDLYGKYIYFPIASSKKEVVIPTGTRIVGKHSFYCCTELRKVTIPSSVICLQNFPFSNCINLSLENHSPTYCVEDGVCYTSDKEELIGVLPSTESDCLTLPEGLKIIRRNSFYKCEGIRKIVLPSTLEKIGYNPFVGCDMEFVSKSPNFQVIDGILYNHDASKLICCPKSKAIGIFAVPESVIELERGAFSGCDLLEGISLKNVAFIGKSCFTNCASLKKVTLSDFVSYVGEWAFAHCESLQEVSSYEGTIIDRNAFLNTSAKLKMREERSNTLVESDNIFTLKSLQRTLKGKIDSIVIDPPYNSKVGYIGYQDDFGGSYLEFMEKRLLLAKDLLSDEGWLILNIDKGEFKHLLSLMKRIFGAFNVSWKLWKTSNRKFDQNRSLNTKKKKGSRFECVILARKSKKAKLGKVIDSKGKERKMPFILDEYGTNSSAKDELFNELGERGLFQTPKPTKLIKEFIRATSKKDSIVLDFFAGSGTAGKAVVELNGEDVGNRHYILVTNNESGICEKVTRKRLVGKYMDI